MVIFAASVNVVDIARDIVGVVVVVVGGGGGGGDGGGVGVGVIAVVYRLLLLL